MSKTDKKVATTKPVTKNKTTKVHVTIEERLKLFDLDCSQHPSYYKVD